MSKSFERYLKTTFGNTYLKERQGLFGIPDFVFYGNESNEISIVSFELKLKDWRRAAKQAFRYKSFSNVAYVVLSANSVNAALSNIELFEKYNIGLAKFDVDREFEILYKPAPRNPYSENLTKKLIQSISGCRKKSKNIDMLV